jgi:hypothetical protein
VSVGNPILMVRPKTQDYRSPISRHLDEWTRLSDDHRNATLGQVWLDDIEPFYNLVDQGDPLPSFRPLIRIPQLQVLMAMEANDLTETSPEPYIVNQQKGQRDEEREKGLQCEWRRSQINYHSMFTILMSMYSGMAPLQLGFDPDARQGRGALWAKMRDPRSFKCDPFTDYTLNWSFIILEDWRHLDAVKADYPETARYVKPRVQGRSMSPIVTSGGYGFQMPPGPMSLVPGLPNNRRIPDDNRVLVRQCYCLDYTREKIEDHQLPSGEVVPGDFAWKYPNGRFIVECEGWILSDGDNPWPLKLFPIVPFWSTLPLYSFWTVPAVRYSKEIQHVAERLYTGMFENFVRLNNAVWFIDDRTGIDPESFGGLPGEVQVINANSPVPQQVAPTPWPAHAVQAPQLLLDKQKELQGFTPARQGQPSAGNISPELFDESILRSQGITQLRGRLNAVAYQRIGELMFYSMLRYYRTQALYMKSSKGYEIVKWPETQRPDQFDFEFDPETIVPFSKAMLRRLMPELRKMGMMDVASGLDIAGIPKAEQVAERLEHEQALAALARTRGARR